MQQTNNEIKKEVQQTEIQNQKKQSIFQDQRLMTFLFLNLVLNASGGLIIPFFPYDAYQKGLNNSTIGAIYSTHPFSGFIISIFSYVIMKNLGRKKTVVIGILLGGIGVLLMGFITFLTKEQQALYISAAFFCRFLQGISRSLYGSACMAFVPILWPNQIIQVISLLEVITGIGMFMGPVMGSSLYYLGGYVLPFIVIGTMVLCGLVPSMNFLPNDQQQINKSKNVSVLGLIFGSKQILSTCLLLLGASTSLTFIYPLMNKYLSSFDLNNEEIGYIFSTSNITYISTSILLTKKFSNVKKKYVLILGSILGILSTQLVSGENMIGFKAHWGFFLCGMLVLGVSHSLCVIPFIPEIRSLILEKFPEEKLVAGDISSTLFFSSYYCGIIGGPSISGILFDNYLRLKGDDLINPQPANTQYAFLETARIFTLLQIAIIAIYLISLVSFEKKSEQQEQMKNSLLPAQQQEIAKEQGNTQTIQEKYVDVGQDQGTINED